MPELFLLSFDFFCTGLFAVGGGLATIPFLQRMGARRGWFSQAQLANMIALADVAPGPIGPNMAAFVGYSVAGLPGAALAVFALTLPNISIDLAIASLLDRFRRSALMAHLMKIIRPAGAGLICAAAFSLIQISIIRPDAVWSLHEPLGWLQNFDWRCIALYAALLPFAFWKKLKKVHPIAYIATGAIVGILFL